jgi:hypothetical protein
VVRALAGRGLGDPAFPDASGRKESAEEAMAIPTQNQAQAGPPANVLHDQGIPNTLGGVGPQSTPVRLGLPVGVFVVVVIAIAFVMAIFAAR